MMVSPLLTMALVTTLRLVVVGLSAAEPEPGKMSSISASISRVTLLLLESLGFTFNVIPISSLE